LIARISLETGIPPKDLIGLDSRMFSALLQAMKDRAKEVQDANTGKRRHRTS
jgi:hypothetical protein